jgi:hypothetical protein
VHVAHFEFAVIAAIRRPYVHARFDALARANWLTNDAVCQSVINGSMAIWRCVALPSALGYRISSRRVFVRRRRDGKAVRVATPSECEIET